MRATTPADGWRLPMTRVAAGLIIVCGPAVGTAGVGGEGLKRGCGCRGGRQGVGAPVSGPGYGPWAQRRITRPDGPRATRRPYRAHRRPLGGCASPRTAPCRCPRAGSLRGRNAARAEDLRVGEIVSLELQGPGFRFSGRARVAHCTGAAAGVHVLSWEGPAGRALGALVAERLDLTDAGIRGEARKRGWGVVAVSPRRTSAGP